MQLSKSENRIFYRNMISLTVPLAAQNLINVAVQSADVLMLSSVGEIALSAASLAGQIQFVLTLFFFGLTSGACVLTAQYWGKGDTRTIEKILAMTLRFSMVSAFAFALAAVCVPATLMSVFSSDPDIITEGVRYLRIVAPSYVFTGFSTVYLYLLRSVEKVMVSTVVYSISLVANVGFNSVFIFGLLGFPAMGIGGAALGTTLARGIEIIIVGVYAAKSKVLRLHWKDFITRYKLLSADFVHYSLPATINELMWGLGISVTAMIVGHIGASAVAAMSVGTVMRQLATVVCFGIANATAIILGKTLGAGETEKALVYSRRLIKLALGFGVMGASLIFVLKPVVFLITNLTPLADSYLGFLMNILCLQTIAMSFNGVMIVGAFRSGGDTRFALFADIGTLWGVSIVVGVVAAFVLKLPVEWVYVIVLSDEILKLPLCVWRYRSKIWLNNVTR